MLANFLPGLRQLRIPLAAGFVVVAVIVAAVGVDRLSGEGATRLVRDVGQIATTTGKPAALAALAFTAYLIGVVWQALWQSAVRFCCRVVGSRVVRDIHTTTSRAVFAGVSRRVVWQLAEVVAVRLRRELDVTGSPLADEYRGALNRLTEAGRVEDAPGLLMRIGADALTSSAARELLELVPTRLMAQEKELWAGWDQVRAEAEFRSTVAVPLAGLSATLAVVYHPLWWLGVAIAPVLLRIAGQNGERATAVLLEAVRVGKATLFDDGALPVMRWIVTPAAQTPEGVVVTAVPVSAQWLFPGRLFPGRLFPRQFPQVSISSAGPPTRPSAASPIRAE